MNQRKNGTNKNSVSTVIVAGVLLASGSASGQVQNPDAPRGPDVRALASYCGIGPFPQVGKAGPYNRICDSMPDSEKCLALIKSQMNADGTIRARSFEAERNQFCMQLLTRELGAE